MPIPKELFVSHASEDRKLVNRLTHEFERHGIPFWYSRRDLIGAQQWHDEIGAALERCDCEGLEFNILATSFFVSRETVVPTEGDGMAHWREELFATMSDISSSVVDYFKIPPNRVYELGTRVEI